MWKHNPGIVLANKRFELCKVLSQYKSKDGTPYYRMRDCRGKPFSESAESVDREYRVPVTGSK